MTKKFFLATVILSMTFAISCINEEKMGMELLPGSDNFELAFTDTSTVKIFTRKDDSLAISKVNRFIVGCYLDPIFGYTKSEFATSFAQSSTTSFPEDAVCDSMILTFGMDTTNYVYGESEINLNLKVYQLTKEFLFDTTYYNNSTNPAEYHDNVVIGETTILPSEIDSIIKIKISKELGSKIIQRAEGEDFSDIFKGIFVTSGNNYTNNALLKFDPSSSDTKLQLFYHTETNDSLAASYYISTFQARLNFFKTDHTDASFVNQLNNNLIEDTVAYLQPMGGTRILLQFPYIKKYIENTQGTFVLNKAELIFKLPDESITLDSKYAPSNYIQVAGLHKDTESKVYLNEYIDANNNYNSFELQNREYRINISRQIDLLIRKDTEYEIYIFSPGSSSNFNRTIITTQENSNPVKLLLNYTIFEE